MTDAEAIARAWHGAHEHKAVEAGRAPRSPWAGLTHAERAVATAAAAELLAAGIIRPGPALGGAGAPG